VNKPAKPGLVFHSFAEHKDSPKVLVAQYDRENKEDVIEITVIGGTISPEAPLYNDLVELTPTNPEQFSYWADEDGQVVSTNPNYVISALKPVTLEAVYDEDFVAKPSVYLFNVSGIFEGKQSFLGHVNLVDGYELVEYGLLVSTDVKVLTFENATKLVSSAMSPAHEFLRSLNEGTYKSFRGYAIFKGTDGLVTVYSENNFVKNSALAYHFDFNVSEQPNNYGSEDNGYVSSYSYKNLVDSSDFIISFKRVAKNKGGNFNSDALVISPRVDQGGGESYAEFDFAHRVDGELTFEIGYWNATATSLFTVFEVQTWNNNEWITLKDLLPELSGTTIKNISLSIGSTKIRFYAESENSGSNNARVLVDNLMISSSADSKAYNVDFKVDDSIHFTQAIIRHDKLDKPSNPTKVGYEFIGWFDENDVEFNFDTPITRHMTLTAKFEALPQYTVSFNLNGGTGDDDYSDQELFLGDLVTKPADPTKEGFIFAGWFVDNETFLIEWDFENTQVDSDIILYAKWVSATTEYKVTFNSNGGSEVSSQTVIVGNKVTKPADPTKEGFIFAGWFIDDNTFENEWDFEENIVIADITLYSKWILLEPTVVEYIFTSKDWRADKYVDGIKIGTENWTSGKDGNQYQSGRGVQVTSGASGANGTSSIEFTNVVSIEITYSTNASSGAGKIKTLIGGVEVQNFTVTTSGGITNRSAGIVEVDGLSGNIKIEVTTTTNSIYIYSIKVKYLSN
ncbi:InlB B-repeat-containing protein, partial [Acholeplasma equifetale]|uniref:InlB B-repeat-containing protein n=1 Tax=Acholeplasma equifetale TaxID=264634 RepID=UPI00055838D5